MKNFLAKLKHSIVDDPVGAIFILLVAICFGLGLGWGAYQNWLKPTTTAQHTNGIQRIEQAPVVCCLGQLKTVVTMQPGDRCVLPESMFPQTNLGQHLKDDAEAIAESEDGLKFIPGGVPVLCTPMAPNFGRSYVRKIKGPEDSRPWYQLYIPGNTGVNKRALSSVPESERGRFIAVSDGEWGTDN